MKKLNESWPKHIIMQDLFIFMRFLSFVFFFLFLSLIFRIVYEIHIFCMRSICSFRQSMNNLFDFDFNVEKFWSRWKTLSNFNFTLRTTHRLSWRHQICFQKSYHSLQRIASTGVYWLVTPLSLVHNFLEYFQDKSHYNNFNFNFNFKEFEELIDWRMILD